LEPYKECVGPQDASLSH